MKGEMTVTHEPDRRRIIVRTSFIGILANIALAGFKAAVGLLANSISIVLDAVNNLSDALSSVVTIIGAKLSAKPADRKHPLGHGRVEYLSALVIGIIVLYAGVTAMIESVKKIITPEIPDYTVLTLIVVAAAVAVKIALGTFFIRTGKKTVSDSLTASGKDALMDAVISTSVLISAAVYLIWGVSLEAYLGVIISVFIIKAGVDVLRGTISQILGERIDSELSRRIKEELAAYPGVSGAYDLILHAYGPEKLVGSIHIEVPDTISAVELDKLERQMTAEIYQKYGVILTGISIYPVPETDQLFHAVRDELKAYQNVLQIHGFHLDKETKTVVFDIVVSFDAPDRLALCEEIDAALEQNHPGYTFYITLDNDISD